jgi:hypothetical protein
MIDRNLRIMRRVLSLCVLPSVLIVISFVKLSEQHVRE